MRGSLFAPHLVDALLQASASEFFWMALEPINIVNFLWDRERATPPWYIDFEQFKELSKVFAAIVDAKSAFTLRHSQGVAQLSRYLGGLAGLPPPVCDRLEVAGLLHDLGKLKVPDHILEKRGPLTEEERQAIHRHSFESYQILHRIGGLEDIAHWAAYHHETPNGGGYPFNRKGPELSLEARIIAVADVFQALAQNRPYRAALAPPTILSILREFAADDRLDSELVELTARHLGPCWQAAVSSEPTQRPDHPPLAQSAFA